MHKLDRLGHLWEPYSLDVFLVRVLQMHKAEQHASD